MEKIGGRTAVVMVLFSCSVVVRYTVSTVVSCFRRTAETRSSFSKKLKPCSSFSKKLKLCLVSAETIVLVSAKTETNL